MRPSAYLYHFQFDMAIGTGAGDGIIVPADGATDLVLTTFLPGGGHTYSGSTNSCGLPNAGDGTLTDLHSSNALGGVGETQFDLLGSTFSAFGGFGIAGTVGGADGVSEVAVNSIQVFEPALAVRVDSATGAGVEEGLGSVHYDCPPGVGGKLGARLYAWQGIGERAAVVGTLAPPLSSCLNFLGGKLGLSPVDPLFGVFLGLWQGPVVQSDNGSPGTGIWYDDGTFDTSLIPLPPQAVPVGMTIPLSFQGFFRSAGGPLVGSQVRRIFLHG